LLDFFCEWKPFPIFIRVRESYLRLVIVITRKKAPVVWTIFRCFSTYP